MTRPIYMDAHSTTPIDPRVLEAMLPYLSAEFGNASSRTHAFGWRAEEAVNRARLQVARTIGADPKEIIFTSGATESNNLALLGVGARRSAQGDHLITAATEHPAVLDPVHQLEQRGWRVTVLPVDRDGRVDPEDVRRAITPRTVLVTLMCANNEVGTLHPISAVGAICKEKGVLLHSDAAQAAGKIPLDVQAQHIDLLSISGHKVHGPKGVGALYVRRRDPRVLLEPIEFGGGHERGLRPGTLNVPGIVALGVALELARAEMPAESRRLAALRDRLERGLQERLPDVEVNGHPTERLPHNLNMSFPGVEGEALIMALDDVAVSSGSACSSARKEPSAVLRAMGRSPEQAQTSLRFGLHRFNTDDEVTRVIDRVSAAVMRLRGLSPMYATGNSTRSTEPAPAH